jgi:hypothetical protein
MELQNMIELVYVSKASKRFNADELKEMLSAFRKNNQAHQISGLLLYDGFGTFIQVLEGDAEVLHLLYEKIRNDARHTRVNLLGENKIQARSFADWRMGFKLLDQSPITAIDGYSNFLQQTDRPNYLVQQPKFAIELLEYFKHNNKSNLDKD